MWADSTSSDVISPPSGVQMFGLVLAGLAVVSLRGLMDKAPPSESLDTFPLELIRTRRRCGFDPRRGYCVSLSQLHTAHVPRNMRRNRGMRFRRAPAAKHQTSARGAAQHVRATDSCMLTGARANAEWDCKEIWNWFQTVESTTQLNPTPPSKRLPVGKFVCRMITDIVLDRAACGRFVGAGPINNVLRACLRPRAQLGAWVSVCALVLVGLRHMTPIAPRCSACDATCRCAISRQHAGVVEFGARRRLVSRRQI